MSLKNRPFVFTLLTSLVLAGTVGLIDPNLAVAADRNGTVLLNKGMSYEEARPLILKAGWKPNLKGEKNLRDRRVKSLFDAGYTEIEDCSGTGLAPCLFSFTNAQGEMLSVSTNTGRGGNVLRDWWVKKQAVRSNKIADGRYWLGNTDQGLEVQGSQYRYDDEGGTKPWRSSRELKFIKTGVLIDSNQTYWCLASLAPKNQAIACSENGWVTGVTKPSTEPHD